MTDYIFICYTHENTLFTLRLARALQRQGLSVWLDQWATSPEAEWEHEIAQAVRRCSAFLAIFSPEAVNSWIVRDQTLLALNEGKSIIPVVYRPCVLPVALQEHYPVDFTRLRFQAGVQQVYARLTGAPLAEARASRLPIEIPWERLRRQSLPPVIGLAVLILLSLAGFSLWPGLPAESEGVPEPAILALDAQPLLVPPVETLPGPNPLPTPINIKVRPQDGKVMVLIPAGEFLRGSIEDDSLASDDEKPQRLLYLDTFWIDKTEITNAQYQLCREAGACTDPMAQLNDFTAGQLPVVGVDWEQARNYCEWVGARLPTEAEWEKAARGTDGRLYPWGNTFDGTRLNYCDTNCIADWRDFGVDDGYRFTSPVGNYREGASPWGALDMSGNVWEWTADWYAPDAYLQSAYRNPAGPETGLQRVIRGGSWYYQDKSVRITERHKDTPTSRYDNIGFRCAMEDRELPGGGGPHMPAH